MTSNIINSIKIYLKSISALKALIYNDSSLDISKTFTVNPSADIISPAVTFIMEDNDDGTPLISDTSDYFLNWFFKYTGGSEDKYIQIIAYNNTTAEVTIAEPFDNDLLTTDTLQLVVLDAIFIDNGSGFQSYMRATATEEKLPIYLNLQTKHDSTRERIRDNSDIIKFDLIKKKKRLPIYDTNGSDICGYMKILSSVGDNPKQNDDVQIQLALMSFTVSYTMNYTR